MSLENSNRYIEGFGSLYERTRLSVRDIFWVLLKKQKKNLVDIWFETISSEEINSLYDNVWYRLWTGALRYWYDFDNKYNGIDHDAIISVLDSILDQWIMPHYDPLNESRKTNTTHTSSITSNRMYARLYADKYNYNDLDYYYGKSKEWRIHLWSRILMDVFIDNIIKKDISIAHKWSELSMWLDHIIKNKDSYRHPKTWHLNLSWFVIWAKTDIDNNFWILIGIKKDTKLDVAPIAASWWRKTETRISSPISVDSFSHIEVPAFYVDLVRKHISNKWIQCPIIAMEDGERLCSTLWNKQLTKLNHFL